MKGYMRILPSWYGDIEKKLKELVKNFAIEHEIDFTFVKDSKNISECIESICFSLVRIFEEVVPYGETRESLEKRREETKKLRDAERHKHARRKKKVP